MQIPAISTQSVSSGVIRIIVRIQRLARMEDGEVSGLAVWTRNRELTKCRTRYAGNSRVVTRAPDALRLAGSGINSERLTDEAGKWFSRSAACLSRNIFLAYSYPRFPIRTRLSSRVNKSLLVNALHFLYPRLNSSLDTTHPSGPVTKNASIGARDRRRAATPCGPLQTHPRASPYIQ